MKLEVLQFKPSRLLQNQTSTNQVNLVNSSICSTINSENTTLVQNENSIQESSQNKKTPKTEIKHSKNKEKVAVEETLKQYKPNVKNPRKKLVFRYKKST